MTTLFVILRLFMAFWVILLAIATVGKVVSAYNSPPGLTSSFDPRPSWKVLAVTVVIAGGLVVLVPLVLA